MRKEDNFYKTFKKLSTFSVDNAVVIHRIKLFAVLYPLSSSKLISYQPLYTKEKRRFYL